MARGSVWMEIELLRQIGSLPAGRMVVTYVATTEGALLCCDSNGKPLLLPKDSICLIHASCLHDDPVQRQQAKATSAAPAA